MVVTMPTPVPHFEAVSCNPGWSWTCRNDDLELPVFPLCLLSTGVIIDMHQHAQVASISLK